MKKYNFLILIFIFFISYSSTRSSFLFDKYSINNDAANHLVWLKQADLFSPYDKTVPFAALIQPAGIIPIHRFLSFFLSIKATVIILDIIRFALLSLLSYFTIKKIFPEEKSRLLFFLGITSLLLMTSITASIGLSRSFATLFILTTICALLYDNKYLLSAGILLSAIISPPAFLITIVYTALTYIILLLRDRISFKTIISKNISVLIVVLIGLTVNIVYSKKISDSEMGGQTIDLAFIKHDPHASAKGRVNLRDIWDHPVKVLNLSVVGMSQNFIPIDKVKYVIPVKKIKHYNPYIAVFILSGLLAAYLLVLVYQKRKDVKDYIGHPSIKILLTGLILYALAILLPFKLYIPGRYMEYTYSIGFILLMLAIVKSTPGKKVAMAMVVLILGYGVYNDIRYREDTYASDATLYTQVEQNMPPKSMTLCNSIEFSNMIPYFSNRSIYGTYENLHAIYFEHYRKMMDEKMAVWNEVFCSSDPKQLSAMLEGNKIDYLLLQYPYYKIVDETVPEPFVITANEHSAMKSALEKTTQYKQFSSGGRQYRIYTTADVKAALQSEQVAMP